MKRLLLYVHFNKHGQFSKHVDYQLRKMRSLYSQVVFISNSPLKIEIVEYLKKEHLIDQFLQRDNTGFDFAAWRDGMYLVGFDAIKEYDSVTLMNDTCFGPIQDMLPIYQHFEEAERVDFWGITNNREMARPGHMQSFQEHVQSYFISFKQSTLKSAVFIDFWQNVKDYTNVEDVIIQYETAMTQLFVKNGLCYDVLFNTVNEDLTGIPHPDFTVFGPHKLLEHKVPFLKIKLFFNDQLRTPVIFRDVLPNIDYPTELIIHHLSNIYGPAANYLLSQKYHKGQGLSPKLAEKRIAVHLHTFYVDLLEEFLDVFAGFHFQYDLYLTTNTEEKRLEIQRILDSRGVFAAIYVTGNVGRDVLPMLKLKEQLSQYDYIGHFHTKKSKEAAAWVGESWRKELIEMLVKPSDEILSSFAEDSELGLMIADIPTYFRYVKMDTTVEATFLPEMEELWKKMGMKKDPVFFDEPTYIMSYGTFVWFKYDALAPLFDLGLTDSDVPGEPLPQNTILHAIERMLVYIAWGKNYDFLIRQNPYQIPPFVDNRIINRKELFIHNESWDIDFNQYGGIKGAIRFLCKAPIRAVKYIIKRGMSKLQ